MKELICIVCPKGCHLKVDEDNGWTVYTIDGGLSAQIEYMVLVKEDGIEVLTK